MNSSGNGMLTRRQALAAGAAAISLAAYPERALASAGARGWIDAHSHIWSSDVQRWPLAAGQTPADLDPPSFTDAELMAVAKLEGVERVVLIQHSIYHLFDNSYLLDAVARHGDRFRAVGMVDDRAKEPAGAMRRLLPRGVTGFRITPFIRKPDEEHWLSGSGMHAMWKAAADTRQAMCCLIDASELPSLDRMCAAHPETPVVVDHFARIGVDGELRDADIGALCKLARFEHTAVKISAVYALGKKQPPHLELTPMIKRLIDAFGPKRLMWASDSPYQLQKGNTYAASIALVRDKLDFVTKEDRQWLLRKTAEQVFFFR
jgi:L-fuconolactonase